MAPEPEPRPDAGIEELKADIEQTRTDLGETVSALTDKLDVKGRAEDAMHDAKENVVQRGHDAVGTVKQQPALPVALLVAVVLGIGVIVWRRRR